MSPFWPFLTLLNPEQVASFWSFLPKSEGNQAAPNLDGSSWCIWGVNEGFILIRSCLTSSNEVCNSRNVAFSCFQIPLLLWRLSSFFFLLNLHQTWKDNVFVLLKRKCDFSTYLHQFSAVQESGLKFEDVEIIQHEACSKLFFSSLQDFSLSKVFSLIIWEYIFINLNYFLRKSVC